MTGSLPAAGERDVRVDGRTVRVSRLDRVLWPTTGTTKAELIDYYVRMAPVLLSHLHDRPVTLHRFPEGVERRGFFQTRVPPHPPWVRTVTMSFPRTGKTFRAPLVSDLPSLVWAANLSTIELHPYLGRADRLDTPTVLVFDLDPGPPAGLLDAAAVALRVRDVLDAAGLVSFPKTSGGKGIHVYVPLNTDVGYPATKAYARAVARLLAAADPARVVDRMAKDVRAGRVFVDWSQNDAGKSTVAPYSLRALRVPAVSTPVTWEEVVEAVHRADVRRLAFGPAHVVTRVERDGDLFAPVLHRTQGLTRALPVARLP